VELQKITKIYERLATFSLELPRDAASLGPDFLRELISLCRNYLNETAHYMQDVLVEESFLAMRLDGAESAYKIRSSELLANDGRVSSRPNIADRQAVIDNILGTEKQSITQLQSELRGLEYVKTIIRNRQVELNNTMSSIRLQRSLLKDALRTGAFYGDETDRSRGRGGMDPADELDTVDLQALLASSEAELEDERKSANPLPLASDPADTLEASEFEALLQGEPQPESDEPSSVEPSSVETADIDESEASLNQALNRFMDEADEDVASILANL
jgi:hypothetical protein